MDYGEESGKGSMGMSGKAEYDDYDKTGSKYETSYRKEDDKDSKSKSKGKIKSKMYYSNKASTKPYYDKEENEEEEEKEENM